ncbi:hypothetical protein P389DRAFT_198865 [Cystobasidium minutum MCA 4210]|uniref:uncharacterized protein n=1 Tax=Cystobasidium minutum MCA 4210 TaxID=1397322 RepID=UPI0034D01388|eukprot:jgi/Rhomi1/198865/gm1.7079_g
MDAAASQGSPEMTLASYLPIYFAVRETLEKSKTVMSIMMAVVVFEWLSSLPNEVRLVWRSKVSWLNACFIVNRYGVLAALSYITYLFYFPSGTMEDCKRVYLYQSYMPSVVFICANTLLTARVFALTDKSKVILIAMIALLLGEVGVHIWVPLQTEAREMPAGIPQINLPDIRGCVPGGAGLKYYWIYFCLQVIFDAVAFIFALLPFAKDSSKMTHAGEIWRVLLRDSLGYFALCLGANLANIIYFALAGDFDNASLLAPVVLGVQSIAASRILFNLRSAARETSNVRMASDHSGSEGGHILSGSTAVSKRSTLSANKMAKDLPAIRVELEVATATSSNTHLPRCADAIHASEKGIELDNWKTVSGTERCGEAL